MMELYKKYRPTKFSEMVGQKDAVKMLMDLGKRGAIPHCILFTGPSGAGKTSLARILRTKLKCSDSDFEEINAAETRGIDMVRGIASRMPLAPMSGKCRVWLVDEFQKTTDDAQSAFLKILEDTHSHVYFMLATTDPQKLKRTIITRSTEIKLKALDSDDMMSLLVKICEKELEEGNPSSGNLLSEEVRDKIVDAADGSPRKALVILHAVIGLDDEEEQLRVVEAGYSSRDAIEIARALLNPRTNWKGMCKILNGIEGLETASEGIRRLVLSYMSTVALKGGSNMGRVCNIIDAFRDDWFNCGKAGLISACYEVFHAK